MKSKTILFDIDGTLNDFSAILNKMVLEETGDTEFRASNDHYHLSESCSKYKDTIHDIIERQKKYLVDPQFYIEEAASVVRFLKYMLGYRIEILTARGGHSDIVAPYESQREEVMQSLLTAKIPFDEFHFGVEDKAAFARGKGYVAIVEDAVHQVETLHDVITTIVMDRGYNRNVKVGKRVYSHYNILNVITGNNKINFEIEVKEVDAYMKSRFDMRCEDGV